jgi:hypothetical protein
MPAFSFVSDQIALPPGAWARTHRRRLSVEGQSLLALTQGEFRAYLHPIFTPAGFAVTAEAPADHPHHSGLWIAADHVHALMPAAEGTIEEYAYNFYVGETFQGRAPGRIVETAVEGGPIGSGFEIVQHLDWIGPREWGAAAGRTVARETRVLHVRCDTAHRHLDVRSAFTAGPLALRLGPTRHAWFNARVTDSMIVGNGGRILDDRGREGATAVSGEGARWVDFTGPVGGGHVAGITVVTHPEPGRTPFWFVADWGVVSVGPFRHEPLGLDPGETWHSHHSVLVHDGPPDLEAIARIAEQAVSC